MTSPAPQPADGERDLMAALQKSLGLPPRPTTPASAEPTEGDWDAAQGCIERACQGNDWSEVIARALASQRAEIVARYEAVAAGMDDESLTPDVAESTTWAAAAARIREAVPK